MKRLPASTWKKHVANYAKSDMTVKDYCRKHKIQPKTLYYWKKKLGDPMRCPLARKLTHPLAQN